MFESLNCVDWDLLHRQKVVLMKVASRRRRGREELRGIIHLLDAIQDDAIAAGRWAFPDEPDGKGGRHGRG
jgi:hypothetical protein